MDNNVRTLLDYVVEVFDTQKSDEATAKLQEGWVLLGVFGENWPVYSLGRIPEAWIPVKSERKNALRR